MQGFTTVRDAGGADYGFREAVASGLYPGPRLLVSGRPLSQTGGHADKRRRAEWIDPVGCCVGMVGVIADGPDEVRKAAREQLRHDVDQIKIMASGGAMSPGDELDTTQYTVEEMRAAVEEAARSASTCSPTPTPAPRSATPIQAGVRCIEHGNLLDAAGRAGHQEGGRLPGARPWSPTRPSGARARTTASATTRSRRSTWPARRAVEGLTHAYRAGCKIGSGSDLLGDMQSQRAMEFELKGQVMKPMEVLLSATRVNAEIFRMEIRDRLGRARQVRRSPRREGQPAQGPPPLPESGQPPPDHEGRGRLQADHMSTAGKRTRNVKRAPASAPAAGASTPPPAAARPAAATGDFEKLGVFYLGRAYDLGAEAVRRTACSSTTPRTWSPTRSASA